MTRATRTALAHGHPTDLDYHRRLLDDGTRLDAYDRALRELVQPGATVLDMGTGSGVLALLAARRGARRVVAVESMPVAGVARAVVQANGLGHIVEVVQDDLLTMPAPEEPFDLIVSDFMGRFLVDDGMLPVMERVAGWLKPGGVFCPAAVGLLVAPVGDLYLRSVEMFREPILGLDFSAALPYTLNYCYQGRLGEDALLAPAQTWAWVEPGQPLPPLEGDLVFEATRGGRLQGFAGWFDAHLASTVLLSTRPGTDTHWGQYIFPAPPCEVEPGDLIHLHLGLGFERGDDVWLWSGWIEREGRVVGRFELESLQRLGERGPGGEVYRG